MRSLRRLGWALACFAVLLVLPATALATPTTTITAPAAGSTWAVGKPLNVAGAGVAAGGRRLRRSSLHWTLSSRACSGCTPEPVAAFTGSSGTFTTPDLARPPQLVLTLTATDYDGETADDTVVLDAETSDVELRTAPPGLLVSLGDVTGPAPLRATFVVGSQVEIDAPDPQTLFGYDYAFGAWSPPVPQHATITVPESDSTYQASFRFTGRRMLLGSDAVGTQTASAAPGAGASYRLLAARSGTFDRVRVYVDESSTASALGVAVYADAAGAPGALLGAGTATTVTPGSWSEVALDPQPKPSAGRVYWVSVQNRATSAGPLVWRVGPDASPSAYALGPAPPPPDGGIDVEPDHLSFATAAGGHAPPAQSIVVQANNGGCGPCAWSISDDAGWLTETPAAGNWPTEVDVTVDPSGLVAGIYRAMLTVS